MVKVKSDKYFQFEKDRKASYAGMGMDYPKDGCTPVDMYGKRVNLDQNDPTNLKKTAEDIQDVYGLEPSTNEPDNGGLAVEDIEDDMVD